MLAQTGTESLTDAINKLDAKRPKNLQIENEFSAFEKEVKEIADLICEYGLKKTFGQSEQDYKNKRKQFLKVKNNLLKIATTALSKGNLELLNYCSGYKKGQTKLMKI